MQAPVIIDYFKSPTTVMTQKIIIQATLYRNYGVPRNLFTRHYKHVKGKLSVLRGHRELLRMRDLRTPLVQTGRRIGDTNHVSMPSDAELIEAQQGGQTAAKVPLIATN